MLAQLVGAEGLVVAIDVQLEALESTRTLLGQAQDARRAGLAAVQLLEADHGRLLELVGPEWRGATQALVFNLGYLPGADKLLITRPESTLRALEAALRLLAPGGLLAIVVYPGHPGGAEEALAVERWLGAASGRYFRWLIETDRPDGTYPPTAPRLLAVERLTAPLLEPLTGNYPFS